MPTQPKINANMRAILIDWLVEVQENFELYHETLYLSVKIVDHYLEKNNIERDQLQLLGATAVFLACKIEVGFLCQSDIKLVRKVAMCAPLLMIVCNIYA